MLSRITALALLLVVSNAGLWIAMSCAGDSKPAEDDSAAGDYCTIMCKAHGRNCVHESQPETCMCSMSSRPDLMHAMFVAPAVMQSLSDLYVLFQSERAGLPELNPPFAAVLEAPSPPPRS